MKPQQTKKKKNTMVKVFISKKDRYNRESKRNYFKISLTKKFKYINRPILVGTRGLA